MKKRSDRMSLLADLAERKKRQADQFLADSRARVTRDEATLAQLEQFLAEYQQQLQHKGRQGVAVDQLLMARAFIEKIESTLRQHREAMKTNREQLEQVEQYWRQTYGHLKAMQKLTDRALDQERADAEKQLQKALDERSQLIRPPFI
ncbi:flagellar export protein FliJ [Marinobacterium aestuariivivens]|uniref:Flagellar FliJ protein n=1 Tax=Marinobacterium aestuariivivens TaxID=1698799 RepID=A0ABW1ZX93_9GAMM